MMEDQYKHLIQLSCGGESGRSSVAGRQPGPRIDIEVGQEESVTNERT